MGTERFRITQSGLTCRDVVSYLAIIARREAAIMTTRRFEQINFPPFQLDLTGGRLRRGSEAIELPPKAFGVLRYLAERPGQLVGKEELLDAIWPNVHVGEQVLKVTIAGIRKALTDPFREPRFIET